MLTLGVASALVGGGVAWRMAGTTGGGPPAHAVPTALAPVVRADLVADQAIPGTIGYDAPFSVYGPAGAADQAVREDQQAVETDQVALASDRLSLDDTGIGNAATVGQAQAASTNADAAASADQHQRAGDVASLAADQHALDQATSEQAAAQDRLRSDTAAQRVTQEAQLADQQHQAAAQAQLGTDTVAGAAAQQALVADQHTLATDQQVADDDQLAEQADQTQANQDCTGGTQPTPACQQGQLRVQSDAAKLSSDQQRVATDQGVVAHDQQVADADDATVAAESAAAAQIQRALDGDAITLQGELFAVTDDQAALERDTAATTVAQAKVAGDQAKLTTDTDRAALADPAAVATAGSALLAAQAVAGHALHEAQAKLDADAVALRHAQATLAALQQDAPVGGTITWLPTPGQVISAGQPVYALDGTPVPVLFGAEPFFRALAAGAPDGPDVATLNGALGLPPSSHFSASTAAALTGWQGAHGLPATGRLDVGQVVVAPGPFRVSAVHAVLGGGLTATPVLDATSTTLVVTAQVPLSDLGQVQSGDAVSIDLPNGRQGVQGSVRAIGTTVTVPPSGSGGGGQDGGGGSGPSAVAATVTFSDASAAEGLDQAAVLVHVTTDTAHGVLAAPIDALLALGGGGEGVEVATATGPRVVAVTTGLFTGTQVQINGNGITAGTQVEVPAP